jgi:hypothetical protein
MTLISELIITIPPRETSREDKEKVHDNMEDCWRAEKKEVIGKFNLLLLLRQRRTIRRGPRRGLIDVGHWLLAPPPPFSLLPSLYSSLFSL